MSDYFEIAYAAASDRLCLFTGTGFSKAVSGNSAPSWQGLLESVCALAPDPTTLKTALFPAGTHGVLALDEAAQVISIELVKSGKSIHDEIAAQIASLSVSGDNSAITSFLSTKSVKVVTTNYDKLLEELATPAACHSITPGLPIPRSQARVEVYHVHGSVDSPSNMVVTSDDYFRFINGESYFSRKLSTLLHENTVVILGYSLGDTNLKAILSSYKGFSRSHSISSNIFLISRSPITQHIKDYYAHCYGIRVLDNTEVHSFFQLLNLQMPEAERRLQGSVNDIRNVIFNSFEFTREYLRIETSFFEIVASIAAIGLSINDDRVVKMLGKVISTKIALTQENGAWNQYAHLARWLAYIASILELKGTSIESTYLAAALHSMTTMRSDYYVGYSWHAYSSWSNRWPNVIASNRGLIRTHIESQTSWPDALKVVRSA
ncbi:SIR2 family NAD-dependent protein deacylase [Stenotrophomonas oahuensis]|uniref:SIR2 family protein n=1 Tax=Stenotrophomonas oahuensis TaxID=3003271 RepID=A0ABY9YJR8_9GAMM|nr:SIR2 family protein [Stenotrophomonas sp. A5586]WNH51118.1 SIR2 family protein [Stenotrophomonas sp. A5586]